MQVGRCVRGSAAACPTALPCPRSRASRPAPPLDNPRPRSPPTPPLPVLTVSCLVLERHLNFLLGQEACGGLRWGWEDHKLWDVEVKGGARVTRPAQYPALIVACARPFPPTPIALCSTPLLPPPHQSRPAAPGPVRVVLIGSPGVDAHGLVLALTQTSGMKLSPLTDGRREIDLDDRPCVGVALVPAPPSVTSAGTAQMSTALEITLLPLRGSGPHRSAIWWRAHAIIVALGDEMDEDPGLEQVGDLLASSLELSHGGRATPLLVPVRVRGGRRGSGEGRGQGERGGGVGKGGVGDEGARAGGGGVTEGEAGTAALAELATRLGLNSLPPLSVNVKTREGAVALAKLVVSSVRSKLPEKDQERAQVDRTQASNMARGAARRR